MNSLWSVVVPKTRHVQKINTTNLYSSSFVHVTVCRARYSIEPTGEETSPLTEGETDINISATAKLTWTRCEDNRHSNSYVGGVAGMFLAWDVFGLGYWSSTIVMMLLWLLGSTSIIVFFSSFFWQCPSRCVWVSNKVKVSPKRAVRQTFNMCFCCIRTCSSSLVGPLEITTPTNTHKHYFVIKRQWPNLKLKTKNVQIKTWFIDWILWSSVSFKTTLRSNEIVFVTVVDHEWK